MPVSQPVLSLRTPGAQILVGNEVRLQCEVQRGSFPIWYQFFREDVLLTRREATSWRTKSYSFSVTGENSGNYYCTADNGFGPQRSENINLSVIGKLWIPASDPSLASIPVKVKVAGSCPTLCDPMDYTVHGILQATILEWVASPFTRVSS